MPRDTEHPFSPRRDDGGSLADVVVVFRRWFRLIAWMSATVVAAVIGIALGWPSVWESRAVIRLDQELVHDTYAEYYVQTLQQQVFTDENLAAWVDEFDVHPEEPRAAAIERLAEGLRTEILTQLVTDPVSGRERDLVTGFAVFYRGTYAETAQGVTNAAARAFLDIDQSSQESRGRQRIAFYSREAARYRENIADVEARLAEFKEVNGRALPELTSSNVNAIDRVERDLETIQLQIGNLRRERVLLQSQLSQVPVTSDEALAQLAVLQNEYVRLSSIYQQHHPAVVSVLKQIDVLSQAVGSEAAVPLLLEQRESTTLSLEEARKRYSEDHPEVRRLTRAVAALDERIETMPATTDAEYPDVSSANTLYVQLDTQIKAIDTEIMGLNTRLEDLRAKRDEYERLILQAPRVEQEYLELQRDLENARQMYEETQSKQREAELAMALETGNQGQRLRLAGAASLPTSPAWPPRTALIILGVIVGGTLAIGLAAVQELLASTVRGSKDARRLTGSPPLAMIPRLSNRADRLRNRLHAVGFAVVVLAVGIVSYQGAHGLG